MKKFLLVLICLSLIVTISGCKKTETKEQETYETLENEFSSIADYVDFDKDYHCEKMNVYDSVISEGYKNSVGTYTIFLFSSDVSKY